MWWWRLGCLSAPALSCISIMPLADANKIYVHTRAISLALACVACLSSGLFRSRLVGVGSPEGRFDFCFIVPLAQRAFHCPLAGLNWAVSATHLFLMVSPGPLISSEERDGRPNPPGQDSCGARSPVARALGSRQLRQGVVRTRTCRWTGLGEPRTTCHNETMPTGGTWSARSQPFHSLWRHPQ